jgi:hypothetical protein
MWHIVIVVAWGNRKKCVNGCRLLKANDFLGEHNILNEKRLAKSEDVLPVLIGNIRLVSLKIGFVNLVFLSDGV